MQIILLQDVPKVGRKYEVKNVARGYARNFLIPRRLAEIPTETALIRAEKERERFAAQYVAQTKQLESYLKKLKDVIVNIDGKANEKGHLFAKIHKQDIADALATQADMPIDQAFIVLDTPLGDVGEHMIKVKVNDKEGEFKVVVTKRE